MTTLSRVRLLPLTRVKWRGCVSRNYGVEIFWKGKDRRHAWALPIYLVPDEFYVVTMVGSLV